MRLICASCGKPLSVDEMQWLGDACSRCAREWNDRLTAWREGAHDPDLDQLFASELVPAPVEPEERVH